MDVHDFPPLATAFATASNEMLAAVLDQSTDCIKVIGPEGSLEFMNRNGRAALGIDDFALVAGKNWWDMWPAESQEKVRRSIAQARDHGGARFEAYCPTAKGEPRWWDVSVSPLRDEQGTLRGLISISRDVSADVRARELRETTAAEMKHRLRNAYALTSAIVTMSASGRDEHRDFAREITDRLEQLGIAQALLLDASALGTPTLELLVRRLTEPFCSNAAMLDIALLPPVTLAEEQVRILALVLGEFSTNSNKYGALGHGGKIAITGRVDRGTLRLDWSEQSDRPVAATAREGSSGLALIRRALAAHRGALDVGFRPDGLDLKVELPGF
ncbi:MAG: PAS domain-containing protein [Pseudomonadota bacterium]|nr:PAS domain-containing protein [Pseudomonadota bacterium]